MTRCATKGFTSRTPRSLGGSRPVPITSLTTSPRCCGPTTSIAGCSRPGSVCPDRCRQGLLLPAPSRTCERSVDGSASEYIRGVAGNTPGGQTRAHDRWLLLGEKRSDVLSLSEVQRYGRDSFGDPDFVSIYGLRP